MLESREGLFLDNFPIPPTTETAGPPAASAAGRLRAAHQPRPYLDRRGGQHVFSAGYGDAEHAHGQGTSPYSAADWVLQCLLERSRAGSP